MQPAAIAHLTWLLATVLTALCAQPARSQALYAYRLANQKPGCIAEGINDSGQIAGTHDQGYGTAFLSLPRGGAIRNLSQPGDMWSKGMAVNNAGVVIGLYRDEQGRWLYFITGPDGADRRPFPLPPGMTTFGPRDINDAGLILGDRDGAFGTIVQADGLAWQDVDRPADAVRYYFLRFNESGQVIGRAYYTSSPTQPFSFVTGPGGRGAVWLGSPATQQALYVRSLNDLGQVVGSLTMLSGNNRGFISTPGPSRGIYIKRAGQSHNNLEVLGIDSLGRAFGSQKEPLPSGERRWFAFVTDSDRKVVDLNTLVVNLPPNVTLRQVKDINRNGQMAVQSGPPFTDYGNVCYIVCPRAHCAPD